MLFYFALKLVGAAFLSGIANAQQMSNDPPSYFGAIQNQEYLEWVSNGIDSKYNSSVFLPSIDQDNGAAVHWTVDGDWLHIAVAARCSGWIGFGISEAGGMKGSDMALFTASRPTEIVDAHVVENPDPEEDSCQQDWILLDSSTFGDFLAFEARRKLDTGDPQDKKIVDDSDQTFPPSRIIAAWGNDAEVSYHGTNVARGSVRFYSGDDEESSFQALMDTNSEASFLVLANNFTIPSEEETNYIDFCVSRSDLIAKGVPNTTDSLYLVGFRPTLSPQSAAYVHHFVVTASTDSTESACGENANADNLVFVWAPGEGSFALPVFLGVPLFGSDGYQSFTMEVHYHNPSLDSGIVDNSGVEFFFTNQPREFEVGVLQVGDPFVEQFGSPIGDGLSMHRFECSTDCSSTFLGNGEPVTVFREHLHMHQTGTRITNEQLRNGKVVRSASAEVWEFDQNGNLPIQQDSFQIQPNDSFRTSCYYRGKTNTTFGLGSADEMCIAYLYYYPRKVLEVQNFTIPWLCGYSDPGLEFCFNDYTLSALDEEKQLNREFGECVSDTEPQPTDEDEPVEISGSVSKGIFGAWSVIAAIILVHL